VTFLLDTNVISEIRKGGRADKGVQRWFEAVADNELFLSVLVLGEIRRGIETKRVRDPRAAEALESWLRGLEASFSERLIDVDAPIADAWGRMKVARPLPAIDGLLAATATVHGLTLVTRNTVDFAQVRVKLLNPFAPSSH
jgi:toxin FitB